MRNLLTAYAVPFAIVLAGLIVASAIAISPMIAPYRMASGTGVTWRVNTVTGEVSLCTGIAGANRCN